MTSSAPSSVPPLSTAATTGPVLTIACLCAAWCRTCEGYQPVFEAVVADLARERPGQAVHARWVDVEDEADLLGDLDIETFPTVLVLADGQPRFAGTLTPQPETLQRVLRAAVDGPAIRPPADWQGVVAALAPR